MEPFKAYSRVSDSAFVETVRIYKFYLLTFLLTSAVRSVSFVSSSIDLRYLSMTSN